jgi:hypothetical protein
LFIQYLFLQGLQVLYYWIDIIKYFYNLLLIPEFLYYESSNTVSTVNTCTCTISPAILSVLSIHVLVLSVQQYCTCLHINLYYFSLLPTSYLHYEFVIRWISYEFIFSIEKCFKCLIGLDIKMLQNHISISVSVSFAVVLF